MTDFRDLVGDDLTPEEEARLRRVHELLVAAGPPPELPPDLAELPAKGKSRRYGWQFPLLPPRRVAAGVVLGFATLALMFGVGFLVGSKRHEFDSTHTVAMHATRGAPSSAIASIEVADEDKGGNWPLQLYVQGLPAQPATGHYELWLTRKGKPVALCGPFRVHRGKTVVRMNAPYMLKKFDGWIVTTDDHARVLLTT
jgi:hypothetical protein